MTPTVLAALAFLTAIVTGVFAYAGVRQTSKVEGRSVGRAEMETALANQRERLASIHKEYQEELQHVHESHKQEIERLLAVHTREVEGIKAQYEGEIHELHRQIGLLSSRSRAAESRADEAEAHAKRCDQALAQLQQEHAVLRAEIEGLKP